MIRSTFLLKAGMGAFGVLAKALAALVDHKLWVSVPSHNCFPADSDINH